MTLTTPLEDTKRRLTQFFDHPSTRFGYLVRTTIIVFILLSVGAFLLEYLNPALIEAHANEFLWLERIAVTVFSLEYVLRLWAAKSRGKFVVNFYNVIDLLAILPFFLSYTSFGALRALRLARLLRVFRFAKIMRYFWQTDSGNVSRIVQENVMKNLATIFAILLLHKPLAAFLSSAPSESLGDLLFAGSILALAAMFGFFAFSYEQLDPSHTAKRVFVHITTLFLLLPIGMMFLLIQEILTVFLGQTSPFIWGSIWFVYAGVVLWDFWNVLQVQQPDSDLA